MAYAVDHKGKMVSSSTINNPLAWVNNVGLPNRTNYITGGALYPYVGSIKPYKCPSDKSNKIISYSIVSYLNPVDPYDLNQGAKDNGGTVMNSFDLTSLNSQSMLFVEETNPDKRQANYQIINNNGFCFKTWNPGATFLSIPPDFIPYADFKDYPAWNRHRNKWMNVVFVDGHGEMWQATDPATVDKNLFQSVVLPYPTILSTNPDYQRFYKAFWEGARRK
jgi:prepilin-type processing-associated H-X9-DG protein